MHSAVKQLRKGLEELCKEWTGYAATFTVPTLIEIDWDAELSPSTFTVCDTGVAYHVSWNYLSIKFILTYSPKLHLLILGEHRAVLTLLSVMDGIYIDGLTKADILSLDTPVVLSVPLNVSISKLEDWRGGTSFVIEGYPISYSFSNANKMTCDKSHSTLDIKTLIR